MSKQEWDVLNILRHYRHDWLNHLQLINGYLAMGRVEKVEHLINELVIQSKNESQLSNLNMNDFAEQILTFNWKGYSFRLSFEVVSNTKDWSNWEKVIISYFQYITTLLEDHTTHGEEQHAIIVLNDIEKKTVEVDFQGSLRIDDEWREKITQLEQQYEDHIEQIEWNESECYVKFVIKEYSSSTNHDSIG
ncbi:Spo0B domain-containing protein [Salipaludibacillus daqingensis]|uniref:Spo0B domain-containing protein n=1 Tax=Salipaludibacillus daqingensis TaxID=3041001 RepID=UPI002475B51C|nr:Spo0B C-terminal domain-containing protein [Salipaludibacillus daqingensis]